MGNRHPAKTCATTPFSHGVIMVQKEFAEKLLATSTKNRRAISVVANHTLEIKYIFKVGKKNFTPNPKVDSVILKIIKKCIKSKLKYFYVTLSRA